MKYLILLTLVSSLNAFSFDGDQENKVQEKALIIAIDNGMDSPELDTFLQDKQLNKEDLDFYNEDSQEVED